MLQLAGFGACRDQPPQAEACATKTWRVRVTAFGKRGSTRGPFVPPGVWADGFAAGADFGRAASGHGGRRRAICNAAGAATLAVPRCTGISSGVARESCLPSRAGCLEERTKTALLRRRERIRAE